jgi:hypothetical protein
LGSTFRVASLRRLAFPPTGLDRNLPIPSHRITAQNCPAFVLNTLNLKELNYLRRHPIKTSHTPPETETRRNRSPFVGSVGCASPK